MYNIAKNGIIELCRGDCLSVPLFINIGTKEHPVRFYIKRNPGCAVYLGVMEPNQKFENAVIRKRYDKESVVNEYGDILVHLTPKDTMYLSEGRYFYQVKIEFENGSVNTIVPITQLYITE
jgi:hypothetical protein